MGELIFKYDIMYVFKDRYEFKRFKRKPFFKLLSDVFITKVIFSLLTIPFFVLILHLIHVPLVHALSVIVPFLFFVIMTYYEQHKNTTVFIDNIRKLDISKDRKTLKIEYKDGKRFRIKMMDMPDTDSEKQHIINQLNDH